MVRSSVPRNRNRLSPIPNRMYTDETNSSYKSYDYYSEGFSDYVSTGNGSYPYQPGFHFKVTSRGGARYRITPSVVRKFDPWVDSISLSNALDWTRTTLRSVASKVTPKLDNLSFQKTNDFNIIIALLEWDETLAMFWSRSELSYGSVTWGVLPFCSDLVSLMNTYREIVGGKMAHDLSIGRRCVIKTDIAENGTNPWVKNLHIEGTMRHSARIVSVEYPYSDELAALFILFDELGLHPDINTVWDAIPLSFMIDYFLPIGKLIDLLHPNGWFRPTISIQGGWTFKGTLSFDTQVNNGLNITSRLSQRSCVLDIFMREPVPTRVDNTPVINWQAPGSLDLFNTWYLKLKPKKLRI